MTALSFLAMPLPLSEPATALPDPGPNVEVPSGAGGVWDPSMAVDAAGDTHLAWTGDPTGLRGAYYSQSSDGVTWSAPVRVDAPGADVYAISLAVEREAVPSVGRRYVAFEQSDDIYLATSSDGITWPLPVRVDAAPGGARSKGPSVAASNGRVWVAWADFRVQSDPSIYVRSSTNAGQTWGPEVLLSQADTAGLAPKVEAKGDTIVAVWELVSPPGIAGARSEDGGATWRTGFVAKAAKSYELMGAPDLFLDDLGVSHVAWAHVGYVVVGMAYVQWSRVFYAFSANGTAWAAPVRVDDATSQAAYMRSASIAGLSGTLWVAWTDNRTGDDDVYASWSEDGARWGDGSVNDNDLRVDDTDRNADATDDASQAASPVLRTGGYGVFAAWQDYRGDVRGDLYFSPLTTSPLVITEIQDEPAAEARVEIYNLGRTPYNLASVILHAGASAVVLTSLGSLPAHGHLVVGASADADLRVPLNMGTEGALVWITHRTELLAWVGTGRYGFAPDPLPGESTARFAGTLDYVAAWTRSTPSSFHQRNGVPGPDLAPDLLLNEVLYNPLASGDRFIELHFRGTGARDLTGYRLVGDVVSTFASGIASESWRHFLIAESQDAALFSSLDAGGDNLYLYNPQGRLLDMIGWSGPHIQGRTVARAVDGVGGTRAFDDASALANGWKFDQIPAPQFLELGPPSEGFADLGTSVEFALQAANGAASADYVNVLPPQAPPGWSVTFLHPNRTPVADSPGDSDTLPDLGLVNPGTAVPFLAVVAIPLQGGPEDGGDVTVEAAFASLPWGANVSLRVGIHPYVLVNRTVLPSTVYVAGTGPPYNEIAAVTVSARAAGSPVPNLAFRDVIFLVDTNASMNWNDLANLRVDAVKAYIDRMRPGDRGSMIGFHVFPWVVSNRPLTNATTGGKGDLEADADSLACSPFCYNPWNDAFYYTRIDLAIEKANQWLLAYGDPRKERLEILVNDGPCYPECTNTTRAVSQAAANGIAIYTVGLGPDVDEAYLRDLAESTGGRYFYAERPEDLVAIYETLASPRNDTAALDPTPSDGVPMVEDALPLHITPRPGSYVDPATGLARDPSEVRILPDRTLLRWDVPKIAVGTAWSVRYDVTSTLTGLVDVALYPDARLAYLAWDGSPVIQAIPGAMLRVLPTPDPPFITATQPRDGDTNVPLNTVLGASFSEAMDAPSVRWTVTPAVATTPSWPQANVLLLGHGGLKECETYTAEITQGSDTEGEALRPAAVPNPWSFSTICVRPSVVLTNPAHNDASVPLDATIVVTFSEEMDIAATTAVTTPAVGLTGTWDGAHTTLTLTPDEPFRECTLYTVSASGLDLDGNPLVSGSVPNPWSFQTVCLPRVRYTIDRQPSTGTVLVDNAQYVVPAVFLWLPGDSHRIEAPEFESQGGSRLAFLAWDDGGARDHAFTVGAADRTITASYGLQHPASLTLLGLSSTWPATISYTLFGSPETAAADSAWSSWTDDGAAVTLTPIVAGSQGERWATADTSTWIVSGPLDATARYVHQFLAAVQAEGLDGRGVAIDYTAWGAPGQGTAAPTWSGWVDASTPLSAPGTLTLGVRERYRTQDATLWSVDSSLAVTIAYVHQFEAHVTLVGTDGTHTVGAIWRLDHAEQRVSAVSGAWNDWADAGTELAFDDRTTGEVPRHAEDPTSLVVDHAVDATIRYNEPGPGPTPAPVPANWKPIVSLAYGVLLLLFGFVASTRGERMLRRLRSSLPLAGVELAIGLLSWGTGAFRIPDGDSWLSLGFWLNTGLLASGVASILFLASRRNNAQIRGHS